MSLCLFGYGVLTAVGPRGYPSDTADLARVLVKKSSKSESGVLVMTSSPLTSSLLTSSLLPSSLLTSSLLTSSLLPSSLLTSSLLTSSLLPSSLLTSSLLPSSLLISSLLTSSLLPSSLLTSSLLTSSLLTSSGDHRADLALPELHRPGLRRALAVDATALLLHPPSTFTRRTTFFQHVSNTTV